MMMDSSNGTHQIGKDFILAGRAIFTVANPKGERYTFKVSKKENEDGRAPVYFVALLTGSDNEHDYTYLGLLNAAMGVVKLTKASRFREDTIPVRVAQWIIGLVWRGQTVPEGYFLQHEGKCGRCGRTLTVPSSLITGLGPDCAAMMGLGPKAAPAQPVIDLGDMPEDNSNQAAAMVGVQ